MTQLQRKRRILVATHIVVLGSLLLYNNCAGFSPQQIQQVVQSSQTAPSPVATPATPPPPPVATPTSTATPTPTPAPVSVSFLSGVNLSGGEYNKDMTNGVLYTNYVYPNSKELDYFAAKGLKVIRLPFSANRLQKTRLGALDATELSRLITVVSYANTKGLKVILDPHNYGYLNDNSGVSRLIGIDSQMPSSHLADFWKKTAQAFANHSNVIFGLMNEPYRHTAVQWKAVAVDTLNAIRSTGSKHLILVPGTSWTGAHSWISSGNAAAWAGFTDFNFAYEVHQYFDSDSSGTSDVCVAGSGTSRLLNVTNWARGQKAKLFLGEYGFATNTNCMTEGRAATKHMTDNKDVWIGYTYWTAGSWVSNEDPFNIQPSGIGTSAVMDKPQMSILQQFM